VQVVALICLKWEESITFVQMLFLGVDVKIMGGVVAQIKVVQAVAHIWF
jgi:hypothetical protein